MATLEKVKEKNQIFVCDECKKDIPSKDIITTEAIDNIKILTPPMPFIFIDKDGIITGGNKMARKDLGDKLLTCPHCKTQHLFGFNLK